MVTKEDLKQEIEQLDEGYLELVYRLLQQFPHLQKTTSVVDALRCSRSIDYGVNDENDDEDLLSASVIHLQQQRF